ncbi:DMT family transporter [Micromonospora echinofusca]|uniref:EamA family transporter n=1 Tax=Micromonospora echinofusca TaxID=47858 RepID=A0ABS3VJG8_MICEH|nr:DMT family transporter [Micromonospora echinofusca]MBO4204626.1 EamA family transporter [Micromonospora echinofusca]
MPNRHRNATFTGVTAGVTAGLLWGLAFLLPELLRGWSAVTITMGRYLAYGLVALLIFAMAGAALRRQARQHWRAALTFAVTGNVGYYLLMVLGVQAVGAPVTGIVIGCMPVTIAVVGNLLAPSYPWRRLVVPIALVLLGLLVVNVVELQQAAPAGASSAGVKALGLLAAFSAVGLWTWYAIANARFLDRHPEVPHTGWSTVIGLGTGAVALLAVPLALVTGQLGGTGGGELHLGGLVGASIVLGVLVSWGGTALWNVASGRLPPTAAGMLISVEMMAGFGYVYAARGQWPPLTQVVGFAAVLAGVLTVIRLQSRTAQAAGTAAPAPPGSFPGREKRLRSVNEGARQ